MKLFRSLSSQTTATCCSLQTSVRCIRQRLMILHRQRQAYSVTMLPQSLALMKAKNAVKMVVTKDYKGMLLFAFENGKAAKVPLESYATKTNRKKLTGAYSDKSPLVGLLYTCLRTKRFSSRRHREICSLFTRAHSLSKQPVQHRVLPFSSQKKVTDFSA